MSGLNLLLPKGEENPKCFILCLIYIFWRSLKIYFLISNVWKSKIYVISWHRRFLKLSFILSELCFAKQYLHCFLKRLSWNSHGKNHQAHPLPPHLLLFFFWYIVFLVTCIYNKVQISSHRNLFWQAFANQIYAIYM